MKPIYLAPRWKRTNGGTTITASNVTPDAAHTQYTNANAAALPVTGRGRFIVGSTRGSWRGEMSSQSIQCPRCAEWFETRGDEVVICPHCGELVWVAALAVGVEPC